MQRDLHPDHDSLIIRDMQKTDAALDHLDVRALRMLAILLETRSVTATADLVGISQPAASRTLALLRDATRDRLLVRAGSGYVLTPRAAELAPAVGAALAAVRAVFCAPVFNPANATGRVRVVTTDYGAMVVAGPLATRLAARAPGLELELQSWEASTFEQMSDGGVDLALYADAELPPGILHRDLFHDGYAVLMRRRHKLLDGLAAGAALAPEAVAGWPRAVVLYPEGRRLLADDFALGLGTTPVRTPYFLTGPSVLRHTDTVMVVPARAARDLARDPGIVAVPLAIEAGFVYRVIWHRRVEQDLRLAWVRDQIVAAATVVPSDCGTDTRD